MNKKIKYLFILVALFLLSVPVYALEITNNNDSDYNSSYQFETNDKVYFNKNVLGSSVVAGDIVEIKGNIDGILIGGASDIKHLGVSEYALLGGNSIDVNGSVLKDSLLLGANVYIGKDAKFGRDVFIFGSAVKLSGQFERDVVIYADVVELANTNIIGNAKIFANKVSVSSSKVSSLTSSTSPIVDNDSSIDKTEIIEINNNKTIFSNLLDKIVGYVSLLLTFVVIALIMPKLFDKTSKQEFSISQILSMAGNGLIFIVFVPFICILLLTLVIGIPLSFVLLGIYILTLYLSNAFTGYYFGKYIWNKFIKKEENLLLETFIGITIFFILYLIPYVGVLTSILSFILGTGLVIETVKKK